MDAANKTSAYRYTSVTIPKGSTVSDATLYIKSDTAYLTPKLNIKCTAEDNAAVFSTTAYDISSRGYTTAAVGWDATVGEFAYTPNFAAVINEIVNRPGWASGNSIVVVLIALTGCSYGPMFRNVNAYETPISITYTTSNRKVKRHLVMGGELGTKFGF